MNILKLLIFDCDGVIFDSKLANIRFYNYILKKISRHPLLPEEVEYVHMHTVWEALEYLLRDFPEKLNLAKKIAMETSYDLFFNYLVLEKGVKEFLEWAQNYFYIALCTNRTTSTESVLEHFSLKNFFDYIMSALHIPKSDPKALLCILDTLKVKNNETLYIGDSEVDQSLCKKCGVKLVAYKNPKLKADFYVNNYYELKNLIEKNFIFKKKQILKNDY